MSNETKFFVESCSFFEEEREEANLYLKLWKKYLLRKLNRDSYNIELIEEEYKEHPAHFEGPLCQRSKMYLRLAVKAKFNYEIQV